MICDICGNDFEAIRIDQVHCSRRCNQMAYRKRRKAGTQIVLVKFSPCVVCGKIIEQGRKPKKYCSKRCRNIKSNSPPTEYQVFKSGNKNGVGNLKLGRGEEALRERIEKIGRAADKFFDYNPKHPDIFIRKLEEA